MIALSYFKAYVLMPYVYSAFVYEVYHFSCTIFPVFIAMAGMCFVHFPNVAEISHKKKCNYPLFILAIAAIIEALIFLAFLMNESAYYVILPFHQNVWSPLYISVELAVLAWIVYNGTILIINSDVCDRLCSLFRGSRIFFN